MTEEFLDQLTGHVDDSAEGSEREGPLSLPVLVVPEKCGPHELQAICDLGRELHRLNLDRCSFEEVDFHSGLTTAIIGELDELEMQLCGEILQQWEARIEAARELDGKNA